MSESTPSVLLIQQDPDSKPGYVGQRFEQRGFSATVLTAVQSYDNANPTVDFGDPGRFDAIVALGSVYSVYDDDAIGNWIGDQLRFLAEAHRREIPVLGICFGGQALAAALGGTVERSSRPEVGWRTIESDKPEVLGNGPWMQWHFDRFTVPPGATELARNEAGSQAFTTGRSLGLQFHPEVTVDIISRWLSLAPPAELDRPEVDVPAIRRDTARLAPITEARSYELVDWFIDDIARR